jgi:hypothetical protein
MSQPKPTKNNSIPIYRLVIQDIRKRAKVGKKTYGVYLQANNGRDALMDAYEEALDLAKYLRQKIEEENGMKTKRKEERLKKSETQHLPVAAKKNTKDWCKGSVGRVHQTYWRESGTHILDKKCMVCSKNVERVIKPFGKYDEHWAEWDAAWKEYRQQEKERRECRLF